MLSFDELNLLKSQVEMGVMPTEALEDEFEEMLIDLYLMGFADVQKLVESEPNAEDLREAVFRKFDGKDFRDRLREHSGNVPDTLRVIDTDANRVYLQVSIHTILLVYHFQNLLVGILHATILIHQACHHI
jgi:hypothetical protein